MSARSASVTSAAAQIFDGQGSRGNGAAMRIAPVAVLFRDDMSRLLAEAARSARITHADPVGIDGAVIQAAAIAAALRDEGILEAACAAAATREMTDGLCDAGDLLALRPDPGRALAQLGSSSDARASVCAAIYAALAHVAF